MTRWLWVLVLAVGGYAHGADKVYRWVDAQGVTHFGSAPPPDGTEADEVKVRGGSAAAAESEAPVADAPVAESGDDVDAKLSAIDAEICERARESLRVLREESVVVRRDNSSGERRVLSAEERVEAAKVAEAEVARVCAPEPIK